MKRNFSVLFVLLLLVVAFAVPQAKHVFAAGTYTVTATIDGHDYSISGTDQYALDIDQFIKANGISESAKLQKISVTTPDGVTSIKYDFAGLSFLFPNKDIQVVNNKAEYVLSEVLGAYDSNHDGVALSNLRQLLAPFNNQVTANLTATYADGTSQALQLTVKADQSASLPSSDKVSLTGISLITSAGGEIKATATNGQFTFDLSKIGKADITAIKFTSDNADTLSLFPKDSVFYKPETDLHFVNHEAVVDSSKFASALQTVLSNSNIGSVIGTNLTNSSNQTLATVSDIKVLLQDAQMKDFNGIVADTAGDQSTFGVHFVTGGWVFDQVNNKYVYYDNDKTLHTGWLWENGHYYYLSPVDYYMVTGWTLYQNHWYYMDPTNGDMKTGWIQDGGKRYFLNSDGAMQTGWVSYAGSRYFLNSNGTAQTGWLPYGGHWFFFNKDGVMQTGWVQDGGKWYYLNADGTIKTGWFSYGGVRYFFNPSGAMQTGWGFDGSNWYFFNNDGTIKTGWLHDGNTWYFLNGNGTLKTGWLGYGGVWYFFNRDGSMQTGWLNTGGKWYFLNDGGAMQTGWKLVNGTWYYFYNSGAMAYNTTIGGYKLNASGAWVH